MANLLEVAELSWRIAYPNPSDETPVSKEEFIASAKVQFAYESWVAALNEKQREGYFEVPSYLLTEVEKEVVDNEIDISDLKMLRSLPQEVYLQNIGGLTCKCNYVKSSFNLAQLMCDDDSLSDNDRPYILVGNKIKFPKGAHKSPLPIIFANTGENVPGNIEIDGALGSIIQDKLLVKYLGKIGVEDVTNNSNSNS